MAPPKSKKRASSALADDRSDYSSSGDDGPAQRPTKKTRTSVSKPGATLRDTNGDSYWELSGKRRITMNKYNGKWLIGIREYYESGGKELPGKKGISLSIEQYNTFIQALPEIEKELKKQGESVPRPVYDGGGHSGSGNGEVAGTEHGESEDEGDKIDKLPKKANFEATSEEDEVE